MAVSTVSHPRRNAVIVGGVVVFHIAALWALQSGLVRRTLEIVVPASLLSEVITPPRAVEKPAPLPAPEKPVQPARSPLAAPAPMPLAIADPTPSPSAPVGTIQPQPALAPVEAPVAVAPAAPPAAPPAPPKVELPSSSAEYLQNPTPVYPTLSKRMGEQGRVMVRVLIATDGRPVNAEVLRSSGYERLDRAALEYVMKCRYTPGKVGGVPREMWHEAPVNYVLQ